MSDPRQADTPFRLRSRYSMTDLEAMNYDQLREIGAWRCNCRQACRCKPLVMGKAARQQRQAMRHTTAHQVRRALLR